jgi:GntR family transcriptional regulator/MocR family aminotransferase
MRYPTALTVPITVTREAPEPLHEQIAGQLGRAVEQGLLTHRRRLPSTRDLASLLGVSRGVTEAAYEVLHSRGYLHTRARSGTYVAAGQHPSLPARPAPIDLRPGQLGAEAFPLAAWRAAWRRASFHQPPGLAMPALGLPALRRAIADHLLTGPDTEVVVTSGTAHGLRLVLDALSVSGVALEEPAPPAIRHAIGEVSGLPVDTEGARISAIPAQCQAAVLTPGGNVPLGHRLSAARRRQAAAWAASTGGHLIELTRDAAPRPDRLPSIVVGGFCELLSPSLKLGYALVPRALAGTLGRRLREHAEQPAYVTQLAVAALLQDQILVRLKHRLAGQHAHKRRLAQEILGPIGPDVCYLPAGTDPTAVAAALARRGITVDTLAPYYFSGAPVPPALVLGYAHLPDPALRYALSTVAEVLRQQT